jgi:hypothetical protein
MAVQLQILHPIAGESPLQGFTANGTALCLGGEAITVKVLLLTLDLSFSLNKPAPLTPVGGLPGVNEWTVDFVPGDNIPDLPYALYALAYNNTNALVAETDITLDGGFVPFRKRKEKKAKKNGKKK